MSAPDFFRARLDGMVDPRHPLVVLTGRLPWAQIEQVRAPHFERKARTPGTAVARDMLGEHELEFGGGVGVGGRPRLPIRLMASLLYLKNSFNLSDEELVARWSENVVWQFFSGMEYYEPRLPCDATQIGRLRTAIGEEGLEQLLKFTIQTAVEIKAKVIVVNHKPYEFGVKVSLAVTHKQGLMVGARTFPGNPFDGHTLAQQLEQTANLLQDLGRAPKQAIVDLGYRGVDADNPGVEIIHRGKYKTLTALQRRWLKRRQAIEPAIGHTKSDHRMDRCWLKGAIGDALHAISCAAGYNIRWLMRAIVAQAAKAAKAAFLALSKPALYGLNSATIVLIDLCDVLSFIRVAASASFGRLLPALPAALSVGSR